MSKVTSFWWPLLQVITINWLFYSVSLSVITLCILKLTFNCSTRRVDIKPKYGFSTYREFLNQLRGFILRTMTLCFEHYCMLFHLTWRFCECGAREACVHCESSLFIFLSFFFGVKKHMTVFCQVTPYRNKKNCNICWQCCIQFGSVWLWMLWLDVLKEFNHQMEANTLLLLLLNHQHPQMCGLFKSDDILT